jgi:hypothetical protein
MPDSRGVISLQTDAARLISLCSMADKPVLSRTRPTGSGSEAELWPKPGLMFEGNVVSYLLRPVRRYPLISFTVLACFFGWSIYLAAALGFGSEPSNLPLGPAVAALVVAACQGRAALRAWGRRLVGWAASPWLYAVAVVVPITINLVNITINHLFGAPLPTAAQWATWPQILVGFATMLVMVGIGEEAGWSAFAAPALLRRHGLLPSWLILSAMRITWHLPLMLTGELPWIVGIFGNAGFQLVLLVVFQLRGSRWSVAAVWHSTLNAVGGGFFFAMVTGADQARLGVLLAIAYSVAGGLAYVAWRLFGANPSPTEPTPTPDPVELALARD